jgi:hypothetical protein
VYAGAPWLGMNTVYSYDMDIYRETLGAFRRPGAIAFPMIESRYENEADWSPARIRRQAYWSILTGATGHVFGNEPIWSFSSGWQQSLNSQGAQDMARYASLFRTLPWWKLVPDDAHTIVTQGYGTFGSTDYVTAARSSDSDLVVAYLPSTGTQARTLTVNMASLVRPASARWYNPTTGASILIASSMANTGSRHFTTPGNNGSATNDWALVLDARTGSGLPVPALPAALLALLAGLLLLPAFVLKRADQTRRAQLRS